MNISNAGSRETVGKQATLHEGAHRSYGPAGNAWVVGFHRSKHEQLLLRNVITALTKNLKYKQIPKTRKTTSTQINESQNLAVLSTKDDNNRQHIMQSKQR